MKTDTKFPYDMFPVRVEHKEGNDTKICWFQDEIYADKYIARSNLKSSQYKMESKHDVEIMGKSTGGKSTQKQSSRRSNRSN